MKGPGCVTVLILLTHQVLAEPWGKLREEAPSCEGKMLNACVKKGGQCVQAPFEDNCQGTLIERACTGPKCQCCVPEKAPSCEGKMLNACAKKGGQCVLAPFQDNCQGTLIERACTGPNCQCCVPEEAPSCEGKMLNACAKKGGQCVMAPFKDNCQGTLIERACTGPNCQCCVPEEAPSCEGKLLNACVKKGGYCVMAPFQDNCSGKLIERACTGPNCQCCIPDTPCPQDFSQVESLNEGICMYINSVDTLSWEDARDTCVARGGRLHMPSDVNEFKTFFDTNYNGKQFWLGASDIETEGTWVTTHGEALQSGFPWAAFQPDNMFNEDCLMYPHYWGFNDLECSSKIHYICEACPTGYTRVGPHCLSINTDEKLTWQKASDKCQANGDSLAVVKEFTALQQYLEDNYGGSGKMTFWLGGHISQPEGPEEECFSFNPNDGYIDEACSKKKFFVCSKGI